MAFFSCHLPFCSCLHVHEMYICFNVRLNPCVLDSWGFFLIEWNILFSPLSHFAFPALWPPAHEEVPSCSLLATCTARCMRELRKAMQHKLINLLNSLWDFLFFFFFCRGKGVFFMAPVQRPQHAFYREQCCVAMLRGWTHERGKLRKSRVSISCETSVYQRSPKS